jgi:hypothetical protein
MSNGIVGTRRNPVAVQCRWSRPVLHWTQELRKHVFKKEIRHKIKVSQKGIYWNLENWFRMPQQPNPRQLRMSWCGRHRLLRVYGTQINNSGHRKPNNAFGKTGTNGKNGDTWNLWLAKRLSIRDSTMVTQHGAAAPKSWGARLL